MGICSKSSEKDKENTISTKALLKTNAFDQLQFYFTTESLLRIDADCLVLFCDEKMNFSKNHFVTNVGKFETRKIKEFADSYLNTSNVKITPGQIVFFPISIPSLQFRLIGLVCLKTWDGHDRIRINLEPIMVNLFNDLNTHHITSLAITEFNQQFGIPNQIGCKVISDLLYSNRDWLKLVTLLCRDLQSQTYYMQRVEGYLITNQNVETSRATSHYF